MNHENEGKIYCATTGKFIPPPVEGELKDGEEYRFSGPCEGCIHPLWLKHVSDRQWVGDNRPLELLVRVANVELLQQRTRERSGLTEGPVIEVCTNCV